MPAPLDIGPSLRAAVEALERDAWRGFADTQRTQAEYARREARAAEARRRETKRVLGNALREFARTLGFEITIPGTHAGGISNQALFEILAARGWEYGATTKRLRDHVRVTLLSEFEDEATVPLRFEVEQVAAGAILEWIARRLDRQVSDIDRPALSPAYARAKRKRFGTGRAGSASGALADAVRDRGRITLT